MRKILVGVAFVSAFSAPAIAQNCESVIALSKVVNTTVSDKDSLEQHASNFCNEYSKAQGSGKSSSFGASFKFLSASFGSSTVSAETVASKYCSANNSSVASKDAYKNYIETISPNAYSAYEQCLRMANDHLQFSVDIAGILPTEFSISASFVSPIRAATNAEVSYSASKDVNCKWDDGPDKKIAIQTGGTAILECSRTDSTVKSYVRLVRKDGPGQPLILPWQAYTKEGVPVDTIRDFQKSMEALQNKLSSLGGQIDAVNTRIDGIKLESSKQITLGSFSCGNSASANDPLTFMVGSKDGTGCGVYNENYGRTLGIKIPPFQK